MMNDTHVVRIWLIVVLGIVILGLCLGITTHRSNVIEEPGRVKVKIACIESGNFSSDDCKRIAERSS